METELSRSTPRLCRGPTEFSLYQKWAWKLQEFYAFLLLMGLECPLNSKETFPAQGLQQKLYKRFRLFHTRASLVLPSEEAAWGGRGLWGFVPVVDGRENTWQGTNVFRLSVPKPLHGRFNHILHKGSHLMNCMSLPYLKIWCRGNHFWKMCLEQKPPTPLPLPPLPLPKLSFSSYVLLSLPEKPHWALSDMPSVPAPSCHPISLCRCFSPTLVVLLWGRNKILKETQLLSLWSCLALNKYPFHNCSRWSNSRGSNRLQEPPS